jgi:hypothetical protein
MRHGLPSQALLIGEEDGSNVLGSDQAGSVVAEPDLASRLGHAVKDAVPELAVASERIDVLIVTSHRPMFPRGLSGRKYPAFAGDVDAKSEAATATRSQWP